jgi:PAS domain S-box-containing protein
MVLANRFPMVFWWGPELVQFYNDPYIPILGLRHPGGLGQPARECWADVWPEVGALIERVYHGGPGAWREDLALAPTRRGFPEETYFTFSYSALPDPNSPNGIGGVLATVYETSKKVIAERRMRLLRELSMHLSETRSAQDECRAAVAILERYPKSVPFVLMYLLSEDGRSANLAATGGIAAGSEDAPYEIDLAAQEAPWPLRSVLESRDLRVVENLGARLKNVPPGPWPEPPNSCAIVPIESGDRRFSGFLIAGLNPRIVFDDDYRAFFHLIAAQIATALGNAELRSSEERFRTLAASLPYIVYEADPSGAVTFFSDEYAAYTGRSAQSGLGSRWMVMVHPDDLPAVWQTMDSTLSSGKPFSVEARLRRYDGVFRWHLARALPQRDGSSEIVRWTGTIVDVHDARQAAEERELFAEAGRVLTQALDLRTTLEELAGLTVPQFADWCRIDVSIDGVADSFVVGSERRLDESSHITVPLLAEEETLGSMTVGYGVSDRRYSEEDVPMLEELGRRAGLAIHKARLFEREHRVAESFQEASLPPALPHVPGLAFDAVYAPGNAEAHVGGDWYDAVRLLDGRVVISIGDVAGSGLEAAVTMGNMRHIIRGIAQVHADPSLMLDAADRALRLEQPEKFVTAFVGVIDAIGRTFAYASAGHPPAMLRHVDGSIETLSDTGLPLGLRANGGGSLSRTVTIEDGCSLVLYTDGLTEFARDPETGERALIQLLGDEDVCASRRPARTIVDRMLNGVAPHDDIAVLTINVETARLHNLVQRWTFDSCRADEASAARRDFARSFRAHGGMKEDVATAELVFGELVGNAVRYAPGVVEVIADWSGSEPVLHVCDSGPGFRHIAILPPDLLSESGRGLFIVSSLTHDFHVSKRPEGGSHARAVLSWQRRRLTRTESINTSGPLLYALTDPATIVSVSP